MKGARSGVAVLDAQTLRRDALVMVLRTNGMTVCDDATHAAVAVVHQDAHDRLLELAGTPYLLLLRAGSKIPGRAARQALATIPAGSGMPVFLRAITSALAGEQVAVPASQATKAPPSDPRDLGALSTRERAVLCCMAQGLSNREISTALAISAHTARTHVQNILGKLDVTSRHAAVAIARRGGLDLAEGVP